VIDSRGSDGAKGAATPAPRVGVLALQGDFACHARTLEALGAVAVRVTLPRDLDGLDALVMPGGESTTMLNLLETTKLRAPLAAFVRSMPVLGTCAGLILLSRDASDLTVSTLGPLDVTVERNAYGRQIDSFTDAIDMPVVGGAVHGVFIRAPRIRRVGSGVEVVATHGHEPVGVRSGAVVGLCFHPELTQDLRVHHWFLERVAGLTLPGVPQDDGSPVPARRKAS
jgi:5'-phosphate synthase pdxT subunit